MSGCIRGFSFLVASIGIFLVGCGSKPLNHAPVEDRGAGSANPPTVVDGRTPLAKPLPGADNAGKPGYYTVKPRDTLIGIGLSAGQDHKDIARWNNLDNPNKIEIGQVLRVAPPANGDGGAVSKPVTSTTLSATPIASVPAKPASAASTTTVASSAPVATNTPPPAQQSVSSTPTPAALSGDDDLNWIWPGRGSVIAGFDEVKNKGVDISGSAGDPVLAAADGRVVYAGAGLRGYGNLIILKHNSTYLTAYAHNQSLLVKEDQAVKRGQKIAEMGSSDADRVKLHFEVRKQGKPVDPTKYLPPK
jgi:lipoprotein NlpD